MSVTINRKGKTLESQIDVPEVKSGLSIVSRTKDTVSKNSTLKEELSLKIKKLQGDAPENETLSKKEKILEIGPLESVFPCSESKILDFLVVFQEFDYSISDIAEYSGIGFKTALEVIRDLEEQQVIVKTRNVGRALMYKLNLESKHTQSINRLATDIAVRSVKENKKSKNSVKEAKCPNCSLVAYNQEEIKEKFGMKNHRGKQIVQSWCRECR